MTATYESHSKSLLLLLLLAALLFAVGCDRSALSGSKLTSANYDQITMGMSKTQVETILGKPTSMETKDMLIFKKTTYRYEDGEKFAMVTFKNDEVDGKDTNLDRERSRAPLPPMALRHLALLCSRDCVADDARRLSAGQKPAESERRPGTAGHGEEAGGIDPRHADVRRREGIRW